MTHKITIFASLATFSHCFSKQNAENNTFTAIQAIYNTFHFSPKRGTWPKYLLNIVLTTCSRLSIEIVAYIYIIIYFSVFTLLATMFAIKVQISHVGLLGLFNVHLGVRFYI